MNDDEPTPEEIAITSRAMSPWAQLAGAGRAGRASLPGVRWYGRPLSGIRHARVPRARAVVFQNGPWHNPGNSPEQRGKAR